MSTLRTAALLLLTACATGTYTSDEKTAQNMSIDQARKILMENVSRLELNNIEDQNWHKVIKIRTTPDKLIVTDDTGKHDFPLSEVQTSVVDGTGKFSDQRMYFLTGYHDYGPSFVNALLVLKQNALRTKKDAEADQENFAKSLPEYQKKAVLNEALPEEAMRFKIQAEGAVRDKEFDDAANFYAEAIKIVPWWAAGHFNRALVLGENHDYEEAMHEMKYYQQLLPNSPNAREVQNKIYEWERLKSKHE